MEDTNARLPYFKKIDRAVFDQIDKFKTSPNYAAIQDFYNGLDEEQQKIFKAVLNLVLILLPVLFLGFLSWQNNSLRDDLTLRSSILQKSLEIIGQKESLQDVEPRILSMNPIDSESMLTSRLANVVSGAGLDASRIQVSNFNSESISTSVFRSEADIKFTNFSTDEMVNVLTALIQREKFRVSAIQVTRSVDTNLLNGQFHAVHFSAVGAEPSEE